MPKENPEKEGKFYENRHNETSNLFLPLLYFYF
jgi:hypothetical protein